MYFDSDGCKRAMSYWPSVLKEPWLGGVILGLQGNTTDDPDPMFSALKEVCEWHINNLFSLICKPIVFLIVLAISLCGLAVKVTVMLALLPLWIFVAVTVNIKSGLPDYPQTWLSPYD